MKRIILGAVLALSACDGVVVGPDDAGAGGGSGATGGGSGATGGGSATGGGGGGGGTVDAGRVDDVLTTAELAAAGTYSPLPGVPADPTNAFADNAAAATLGQRLYYDKSYSGALAVGTDGGNGGLGAVGQRGQVACVSCHESTSGADIRSIPNNVSLGTDYGTRNALAVVNASFHTWTNWGGRFDSQWSLPLAVAENGKIMASTRLEVVHMLWTKYRSDYDAIFPVPLDAALDPNATDAARFPAAGKPKALATDPDGPWELMTATDRAIVNRIYANYGKAIAAYLRKLVSRNAPFDRFVEGDGTAISASAKRGFRVFTGRGKCSSCHFGPAFTDGSFHALGVPQTGAHVPAADLGRFTDVVPMLGSAFSTAGAYSDSPDAGKLTGLAQGDAQRGQFRTSMLRGLGASAPYMHSGQFATLADVVDFYDLGGGTVPDGGTLDVGVTPLSLSTQEKADLVAFLQTLDGQAVDAALLMNTAR
jgi:cytochrome c peroxidase